MKVEVAIVGAGPAGISAAVAALLADCKVALIDDNPALGGQIWRGNQGSIDHADLLNNPNLIYLPSTRVVAAPARNCIVLETATEAINLQFARLIVATGARENLLPFPGWTLPGVMGAGGLQAMVKSGMSVKNQRIVLAGTGPLLLAAADSLQRAGAQVLLIAEQAQRVDLLRFAGSLWAYPSRLKQTAQLLWSLRGIPYRASSYVCSASGQDRLHSVHLHTGTQSVDMACDWLGIGYGLIPNTELLRALGCVVANGCAVVDDVMQTSVAHIYAAGEASGVGGVDKAVLEGRIAGLAASGQHRAARALMNQRSRSIKFVRLLEHSFTLRPEITAQVQDDTIICRCEDVTAGQLAGFNNWREAKLQTRCGMGPCQGRICANACSTIYGWRDAHSRPPLQPAKLATLANITSL